MADALLPLRRSRRRLNCPLWIRCSSSMRAIVIAAVSNRLKPSIGPMRNFTRGGPARSGCSNTSMTAASCRLEVAHQLAYRARRRRTIVRSGGSRWCAPQWMINLHVRTRGSGGGLGSFCEVCIMPGTCSSRARSWTGGRCQMPMPARTGRSSKPLYPTTWFSDTQRAEHQPIYEARSMPTKRSGSTRLSFQALRAEAMSPLSCVPPAPMSLRVDQRPCAADPP